MAVNTTTFESTLQTKLNDTTLAAKEMLLLGKALESTVGSIAVSDINTAGATKVSEINTVATNTFKTVGGASILGSGDIATLPSQTGASGKVLKSDGTDATWGTDEGGKLIKTTHKTSSSRVTLATANSRAIWTNTFTKEKASSNILIYSLMPGHGAASDWCGIYCSIDGAARGNDQESYKEIVYLGGNAGNESFVIQVNGKLFSGLSAGSHTVEIGWDVRNSNTGEKPFVTWNPRSVDDARMQETGSNMMIMEVEADGNV